VVYESRNNFGAELTLLLSEVRVFCFTSWTSCTCGSY